MKFLSTIANRIKRIEPSYDYKIRWFFYEKILEIQLISLKFT